MPRTALRTLIAGATLTLAATLAACGGGGGSSSILPGGGGGATPTPTATPTPPPPTAQAAGRVTDAETNGNPGVAGATVKIGTSFDATGTITGVVATATTAADGSYSVPVPLTTSLPISNGISQNASDPPAGTSNAFFAQVDAGGFVSAHKIMYLHTGATSVPTYAIAHPGLNDAAALARVNSDRASLGSGTGKNPVALDSDATLMARFATMTEGAQGFFNHNYPNTTNNVAKSYQCTAALSFCAHYYNSSENESLGGDVLTQEDGYIAEGPTGGHYQAVMNPKNVWVGFAQYLGASPAGSSSPQSMYGAQEYITTP